MEIKQKEIGWEKNIYWEVVGSGGNCTMTLMIAKTGLHVVGAPRELSGVAWLRRMGTI